MSTVLKEGAHPGEFIVSEANVGSGGVARGRDPIVLAATTVAIMAGTVLGKVTASNEHVPLDPDATDGSEAVATILFGNAPASTVAQDAVGCSRDMEVNAAEIVWPEAITPAQLVTAGDQLAANGVIQRAVSDNTVDSADSNVVAEAEDEPPTI